MRNQLTIIIALAAICFLALPGAAREMVVDRQNAKAADTNSGTVAAPFKTIGAAVALVQPGDTILVKNGTYRERVRVPAGRKDARITLKAWPGHQPMVKASEVVKGPWREAHVAVKYRPGQAGDTKNTLTDKLVRNYAEHMERLANGQETKNETKDAVWQGEKPEVPFTGIYAATFNQHTQIVCVNEEPLKQIGRFNYKGAQDWPELIPIDGKNPDDMRPGTFCYDEASKTLYVWLDDSSSPAGKLVDAGVRGECIEVLDYTTLSGFGARHALMKDGVAECGIVGRGKEVIVENCDMRYNDFAGLAVQGEDDIIRNNTMAYNGNCGFESALGDRMLFDGNVMHHNNTRNYNNAWAVGGLKVTQWKDCVFTNNYIYDEATAAGLWYDISCLNMTIANNRFERCLIGVFFEIGRWCTVTNNIMKDCTHGVWSYSSDMLVANNIIDHCQYGIQAWGDLRLNQYSNDPYYQNPKPEFCMMAIRNNMFVNNIVIDAEKSYISTGTENETLCHNISDYNVFVVSDPVKYPLRHLITWDKYYPDGHDGWMKLGQDTHSQVVKSVDFVNRAGGDYRLKPNSPLLKAGITVPTTLASEYYVGILPWAKTYLGADDGKKIDTTELTIPLWGQVHRIQPNPAPFYPFDPNTQPKAAPGLNVEWKKPNSFPAYKINPAPAK